MMSQCDLHGVETDRRGCPWCQLEDMEEQRDIFKRTLDKRDEQLEVRNQMSMDNTTILSDMRDELVKVREQLKKYEARLAEFDGCVEVEGYYLDDILSICLDHHIAIESGGVVTVWVKGERNETAQKD